MFQPDSRTHPSRLKKDSNRPEELNDATFSDDTSNDQEAVRKAQAEAQQAQSPRHAGDRGVTGIDPLAEMDAQNTSPAESLTDDDDRETPSELYGDSASADDLSITDQEHIGAGKGLDEAELGRAKPLDGKRWDGNPNEPFGE